MTVTYNLGVVFFLVVSSASPHDHRGHFEWKQEYYNNDQWHQNYHWYNVPHQNNPYQPINWNNGAHNDHQNRQWNLPKEEIGNNREQNRQWNPPKEEIGNNRELYPSGTHEDIKRNPGEPRQPNLEIGGNRNANTNQQGLKGAPIYNATHNPCTREVAKKPNFNIPGRRISELKCVEFIWNIKESQDFAQKSNECRQYRREYLKVSEFAVIGGYIAQAGEFPHMGALGWRSMQDDWIFKCGATIISPKFMVTAAHCTKSARDPRLSNLVPEIVRYGAKNLVTSPSFYPKDVKISRIIPHPDYKSPRQYFDIALIELQKSLIFDSNVQPACIWNKLKTNSIGTKASASGWGVTEIGGREVTTELRAGNLDLIDNNTCSQLLQPKCNRLWCGLAEHQICAGKLEGGVDACQGDSGGPLQVQINLHPSIERKMYYLLGVTSFGFGCARANAPGVYTRVASFINWIEQVVWANEINMFNNKFS